MLFCKILDLTAVDYTDESNILSEEEIYIGDDTAALLLHLQENEGEVVGNFYRKVIQFYQALDPAVFKLRVLIGQNAVSIFSRSRGIQIARFDW